MLSSRHPRRAAEVDDRATPAALAAWQSEPQQHARSPDSLAAADHVNEEVGDVDVRQSLRQALGTGDVGDGQLASGLRERGGGRLLLVPHQAAT